MSFRVVDHRLGVRFYFASSVEARGKRGRGKYNEGYAHGGFFHRNRVSKRPVPNEAKMRETQPAKDSLIPQREIQLIGVSPRELSPVAL